MVEFYRGLIEMRREYPIFRTHDVAVMEKVFKGENGRATVTLDDHFGGKALIVFNPTTEEMTYELTETWNIICNGIVAGAEVLGVAEGTITVPPYSTVVLVNDNLTK
jgi:hypothetical protein